MREMKDSENEWFGMIPISWNVLKLKNVCFFQEGPGLRTWQFTDSGIKVICVTNITEMGIDFSKMAKYISTDEYKNQYKHFTVEKSDILLASSGASWGKIAIYDSDETVILNTSTMRFHTSDENLLINDYIVWLLKCEITSRQLQLLLTGSCQPNFGPSHIAKLYIALPQLEEQRKIADYLDTKCTKIDSIIEKQQAIIEKLKEYKLSVITEAVTKGLNPDVEMKDSGIECIGLIPQNAVVSKLKYVVEFHNGDRGTNYPSGEDLVDEGIPFLSSNNIHGMNVDINEAETKYITDERYSILGGAKIHINDIVFCLRGSIGICAINKSITDGTIASSLVVIRPQKINPDFLNYLLHSNVIHRQSEVYMNGTCAANLSAQNLGNYLFVEHSMYKQQEIVDYLNDICSKLDLRISSAEHICEKLGEYKKSLIYEVVTGKKEV